MRWDDLNTEACSVARAISVIGDRRTILILRDCFMRVRRFEDFEKRLGITRHVLADRLRKLVRLGVLRRVPYQNKPARYEYRLTPKGLDLQPVLLALVRWGDAHMAGERGRPVSDRTVGAVVEAGRGARPEIERDDALAERVRAPEREVLVRTRPGPGARTTSDTPSPADRAQAG